MTATEAAAYGESSSPRHGSGAPGSADPAAAGVGRALLSIGEVLNLLRPEFTDVTISKLRFLEAEGLVDPHRTPAGYRKYTAAHVERLRIVLAAQRDRYLPLRVIREQLDAMERGERVVGVVAPLPVVPEPRPSSESRPSPEPGNRQLRRNRQLTVNRWRRRSRPRWSHGWSWGRPGSTGRS